MFKNINWSFCIHICGHLGVTHFSAMCNNSLDACVSSQLGESVGTSLVNAANTHDVFIATAQKIREFKNKCTEYDIINVLMVYCLIDNYVNIPLNQKWDFTERTHFQLALLQIL